MNDIQKIVVHNHKERVEIENIIASFMCKPCAETGEYAHELCEGLNNILTKIEETNYQTKEIN